MSTTLLDPRATLDLPLDGARLIEASAGTGKTYTIANLYLRQILEGRTPAEVLVVTFTNAATDELRQRIHARLHEAERVFASDRPGEDEFLARLLERQRELEPEARRQRERRLRYALRAMDESTIATIHGFCHAALQDHALLSNQPFESEIGASDDHEWEQALKDWWRAHTYSLTRAQWELMHLAIPALDNLLDWHHLLRRHPQDRMLPEIDTPLAQLLRDNATPERAETEDAALLCKIRARALAEAHASAVQQVAAQKRAHGRLAYQDQLDLLLAALRLPAGDDLAARLRRRFPVAMIDEFQDTDPVQYEIFRRLFLHPQASLTLIGDPKQAIYGFRGGDIFTYIGARAEPALEHHALATNWRSQPGLVDAVNFLFLRRSAPFIFDQAIEFLPVAAAERNRGAGLTRRGEAEKALTLWQIPLAPSGKTLRVADARERINLAVATEIARLLDPAHRFEIEGRPLCSGDIAVLVRARDEGEALRRVLLAAGIRAVSIGRDQVYESSEARALYELLDAVANPADERRLRRARACALFDLDYVALAGIIDNDQRWQHWVDQIQALHATWVTRGFIAMFQQMLETLDLGGALAAQSSAERRLTNLVHLGELLQQQSRQSAGLDALLAWYRAQMAGEAGEEAELRLESDADLVKIVTIHKSKGLEYPVVFLPFMWRCQRADRGKGPRRFHDSEGRGYFDLGSEKYSAHGILAERERLAEDLRLLYVALTRARSKAYLAWGDVGDGRGVPGQPKHTALAYLLHSQQTPAELATNPPCGFDDPATPLQELPRIAGGCDEIEVLALPGEIAIPAGRAAQAAEPALHARTFDRLLATAWRINSFTSLTRDVHQVAHGGETLPQGDPFLDFPAGSHIGLLLHQLLENLDFQQAVEPRARDSIARLAPAYGIDDAERQRILADWLQTIVDTAIDSNGLCLNQLDSRRRLNELKFDIAVDRLDIDALNRLLEHGVGRALQPVETADFRGLLTGVIDLVFEYQGRFYLADYKSNHLGSRLEDYAPAALAQAMYDRRYDLQSLLYAVALHRYLAQRLPDYRYDAHFGGCYYLFLRAMRPASGPRYGVHFDRPDPERLAAFERLLAFTPPAGAIA